MKLNDDRFRDIDDAALEAALLALHVCPHCRSDLQRVALFNDVYGCKGTAYPTHPFETWFIPPKEEP